MYKCERCGYCTEYKSNLKNHFKRKKVCPPIFSDTSIETLKMKINQKLIKSDEINQNGKNVNPSVNLFNQNVNPSVNPVSTNVNLFNQNVNPSVNPVSTNVNPVNPNVNSDSESSNYECQFCKKIFKYRQSKYRHELKYCKFKNDSNDLMTPNNKDSDDIAKDLKNIGKDLKNIGKYLKDIGKDPKNTGKDPKDILIEKLMQENMELIDKVGNINNIQININNYGNENLDYLTTDFISNLIKIPYKAVPKLIKHIHFNPNHPENHNIKIPNRKEKFAVVYTDGNWELRNKHNVIENIVDNGYNMLDCHYDAGKLILEDVKRNRFIHFQEEFEENDKCRKKIQEETELIMLNKTKLKS